jgi:glycosyltransferase involved in cell wall biosynthesis
MKVSVVVPTYNRGPALGQTLARLLASELSDGDELEILVVDDGSSSPAEEAAAATGLLAQPRRWPLRWLRQANAGPAAARNAGFRAAGGAIVLFVDDDILVPPDLVRAHVAAHRAHPLSVIFGLCPFVPEPRPTPFRRFVDEMERAPLPTDAVTAMPTVASGQISVEREQFAAEEGVYSSDLVTPAAEEYELAYRLRRRGTQILLVPAMRALHDQAVEIASYCRQQYKHGLGCGEAAAKQPDLLGLPELARVIEANRPAGDSRRRVRSGLKSVVAGPAVRAALLALARAQEHLPVPRPLRDAAYRAAISAHFVAGVRDGLARFGRRR